MPDGAGAATGTAGRGRDRLPGLPARTPIHRDFYYSQVLFNQEQLTLIDFDLLALGDPAIDVANFMAHLHFLGMDKLEGFCALAEEAELFLQEYWPLPAC